MSTKPTALIVTVDRDYGYDPDEVRLNGHLIGYHPYDGSSEEEVAETVAGALAGLLREKLGWPQQLH